MAGLQRLVWALGPALVAAATPAAAETERFLVFQRNDRVGHTTVERSGDRATILTDIKSNGRGPTINETLVFDGAGLPTAWTIGGKTTFGSPIEERFERAGAEASWQDSTGPGRAAAGEAIYVAQNASQWAQGLYARALLNDADRRIPALPGGELKLETIETLTLAGPAGPVKATAYFVGGISTSPTIVVLGSDGALLAVPGNSGVTVREGFEGEQLRLRDLAVKWNGARLGKIREAVAHRYPGAVRIGNVRIFDPRTKSLGAPVSVLVRDNRIAGVDAAGVTKPGETLVDGAGGTLVPGMTEMHGHFSEQGALLNLAAGITTIRDMGSNNAALDRILAQIESGTIDGPRILRAGMIEGKSPFNNSAGILADSEQAAVDAVNWYADRDYPWIKIYSSVNPAWIPAMVRQAKARGMKVIGHVPAFTTVDAMIAAGYDEVTHLNQVALSWVIDPATEDTRTLLRATALKRLATLDLDSAAVTRTLDALVARKVALDPTLVILESLMTDRTGYVGARGLRSFENMPVGMQRSLKQASLDLSEPGDDEAYRKGFETFVEVLRRAHRRGIMIAPGTDMGGSFAYHRELELYQRIGMTPADILARASFGMAQYLGQGDRLGTIEAGKLADFFLVPGDPTRDLALLSRIAMVVKDGTVYFPSEIYPYFGIKPFGAAPGVTAAR